MPGAGGIASQAQSSAGALVGVGSLIRGGPESIFPGGLSRALAKELGMYLMDLLRTEPTETPQYARWSTAIREGLRRQGGAAIQGLSETAQARGFLDSGEVISGIGNIRRGELAAYTTGITQILDALEARRTQGVLPYLAAASGESATLAGQELERVRTAIAGLQNSAQQFSNLNLGNTEIAAKYGGAA